MKPRYSTTNACPGCGASFPPLEPRSFSFNSPLGACPECEGLGLKEDFDVDRVIPSWDASLKSGVVAPWRRVSRSETTKLKKKLKPWLEQYDVAWDQTLEKLNSNAKNEFLQGFGDAFPGVLNLLRSEHASCTDEDRLALLDSFRGNSPCPACRGARLREESRHVLVAGRGLHETCNLPISAAAEFFKSLHFPPQDATIATPLVDEALQRLLFLQHVGLDYISLDRATHTLSGGELQRTRLAAAVGAGLSGVCYILDEPSIGLHSRDNERLISALRALQENGATLIVVEHDEDVIRAAELG